MSDKVATFISYCSATALAIAGWGVYECTLLFGAALGAATFLWNRRHKLRLEKQDKEFKQEALKIMREKQSVTIIDIPAQDE